jgi:hypothetical protein
MQEHMIKFLADFFRGFHMIMGISSPPAGQDDKSFVLMWLGILAAAGGAVALLLYLIIFIIFPHTAHPH